MEKQKENLEVETIKILDNQVVRLVAIVGVVFTIVRWVVLPIQQIQSDIATIRLNIADQQVASKALLEHQAIQDAAIQRNTLLIDQVVAKINK